jgi:hypothetical protein
MAQGDTYHLGLFLSKLFADVPKGQAYVLGCGALSELSVRSSNRMAKSRVIVSVPQDKTHFDIMIIWRASANATQWQIFDSCNSREGLDELIKLLPEHHNFVDNTPRNLPRASGRDREVNSCAGNVVALAEWWKESVGADYQNMLPFRLSREDYRAVVDRCNTVMISLRPSIPASAGRKGKWDGTADNKNSSTSTAICLD